MKSSNELKELRSKADKDLTVELDKLYKKLRESRFSAEFRKDKNVKSIAKTKKTIARIWTVLTERLILENETTEEKSDKKAKSRSK